MDVLDKLDENKSTFHLFWSCFTHEDGLNDLSNSLTALFPGYVSCDLYFSLEKKLSSNSDYLKRSSVNSANEVQVFQRCWNVLGSLCQVQEKLHTADENMNSVKESMLLGGVPVTPSPSDTLQPGSAFLPLGIPAAALMFVWLLR